MTCRSNNRSKITGETDVTGLQDSHFPLRFSFDVGWFVTDFRAPPLLPICMYEFSETMLIAQFSVSFMNSVTVLSLSRASCSLKAFFSPPHCSFNFCTTRVEDLSSPSNNSLASILDCPQMLITYFPFSPVFLKAFWCS